MNTNRKLATRTLATAASTSALVFGLLGGTAHAQDAVVVNGGTASANSGGNTAVGSASSNTNVVGQSSGAGAVLGSATSGNSANVSNSNTGSASVKTGDADATGNKSTTDVSQSKNKPGLGKQKAVVVNAGTASANSGGNVAVGAVSSNVNLIGQSSWASALIGSAQSGNSANVSNSNVGSASIETGDASAVGNLSGTSISQTGVGGLFWWLNPQVAVVTNLGAATANSGANSAVGSVSSNVNGLGQIAVAGVFFGTSSSGNSANVSNSSLGEAGIITGSASAVGNASSTDIDQS